MQHWLKIKDMYYWRIENKEKPFEVRLNDRDYQNGDIIYFMSEDGRDQRGKAFEIIYIHSGLGMQENYVVLALKEVTQ